MFAHVMSKVAAPRGAWVGAATALTAAGAVAAALVLQQAAPANRAPAPVVAALAPAPVPAVPEPARAAPPAAPVCRACGTVAEVAAVRRKGKASGVGAVAGGVVGGLVGSQMGKGRGRSAMTVLGAVGGGLAGHEIERRRNSTTHYEVRVRLDDGTQRTLSLAQAWSVGQRVRVDGSRLHRL